MGKKHIWDYLNSKEINIVKEYQNLWHLLTKEMTIYPETSNYYSISAFQLFNNNFIKFKDRDTYIDLADLLQSLRFCDEHANNYILIDEDLDQLDLFIEIILMCISEMDTLEINYIYQYYLKIIRHNIDRIMEKSNQKLVNTTPTEKIAHFIVIPDDELVTSVADLVLPSDEKLALSILGYTHYSGKNNVKMKRNILVQLGNYIEPRLHSNDTKSSDISYALNMWGIRHSNEKQIIFTEDEYNRLYDMLFREILHYILSAEHIRFSKEIERIKNKYNRS